jgi:peptidoglycan/xylan/chitin deacetylase (PgdA/CDA1 family)
MSVGLRFAGAIGRHLPDANRQRLLVLIYHRVLKQKDPLFPFEVDAASFDAQMAAVAKYCSPLPLSEAVQRLDCRDLPARAVAVSFDDGYADNQSIALPILLRHGLVASFFVATRYLNGGRMWNDTVVEAVRRCPASTLDLAHIDLGRWDIGTVNRRREVLSALLKKIKHLPFDDRTSAADDIAAAANVDLPNDLMMTDDQVCSLADSGMEIGGHTHGHPILRVVPDEQARQEIVSNRAILQRLTGRPVRAFAYPNGRPGEDYDPRHREMVQELGFDYAVSTRRGVAGPETDRYQMPRFTPWDANLGAWLGRLILEFRSPQ